MNLWLLDKEIQIKKKKLAFPCQKVITYEKVLLENDFFTQNNINIQEKLKKIDFHSFYFDCFHEYSDADLFKEGKLFSHQQKYIWMTFIKAKKIPLIIYLDQFTGNKLYIENLVLLYQKILSSLIKINKKGICYFNWNENNIFINEKEYPILSNFNCSLDYNSINLNNYYEKIVENSNISFLPIEVHFLYFILKLNISSLTPSLLEDIYKNCNKEINIEYDDFISLFQIYNYKNVKEIIITISKFIPTWDNYCLSKIFLVLLEDFIKKNPYDTKYPFIPKWHSLLKKNVSFNPIKRESLFKTQLLFENILSTF